MKLLKTLSSYKFSLGSEAALQLQIAEALTQADIPFEREYRLSPKERIDFISEGFGIEIKIKTSLSKKGIYKQVLGYAQHDCIKAIVLVTNKSIGMPEELNGKPCYVVNIGRSWL